jgi:hypothetical protein
MFTLELTTEWFDDHETVKVVFNTDGQSDVQGMFDLWKRAMSAFGYQGMDRFILEEESIND